MITQRVCAHAGDVPRKKTMLGCASTTVTSVTTCRERLPFWGRGRLLVLDQLIAWIFAKLRQPCSTPIAQRRMKLHRNRVLRCYRCVVREACHCSRSETNFDFILWPPFHRQPRKIEAMEKALCFVLRKYPVRTFRHAYIDIPNVWVVELLGADE